MKKTLALACGVALFAAQPALAAEATSTFTKSLKEACQPWMQEADRKTLSQNLQADGWNAIDNAVFSKSGAWGNLTVALQQSSGGDAAKSNWMKDHVNNVFGPKPDEAAKRSCSINYSTNDDPWTTAPAVTATAAWIADAFPKVEKKKTGTMDLGGQTVDGAVWSGGNVKVTQIVFQAKQATPNSDVVLKIENE
jgi:hypothetical protein